MPRNPYRKSTRKSRGRKRQLRGYELQSILYRTGIPLTGLFCGIALLILWSAAAAGPGPLRSGLLVISGPFGLVALLLGLKVLLARRFLNAYHGIKELRAMNPVEFEHYIAELFRHLGYRARVTVASGDLGVDIELKKGKEYAVVQCKRYAEHRYVDSPDIQRFIGSMDIYGAPRGFFVATARFSPPALKLAAARHIEAVDDVKLMQLIRKAFPDKGAAPARFPLRKA